VREVTFVGLCVLHGGTFIALKADDRRG